MNVTTMSMHFSCRVCSKVFAGLSIMYRYAFADSKAVRQFRPSESRHVCIMTHRNIQIYIYIQREADPDRSIVNILYRSKCLLYQAGIGSCTGKRLSTVAILQSIYYSTAYILYSISIYVAYSTHTYIQRSMISYIVYIARISRLARTITISQNVRGKPAGNWTRLGFTRWKPTRSPQCSPPLHFLPTSCEK